MIWRDPDARSAARAVHSGVWVRQPFGSKMFGFAKVFDTFAKWFFVGPRSKIQKNTVKQLVLDANCKKHRKANILLWAPDQELQKTC